jgi:hypothetical protein
MLYLAGSSCEVCASEKYIVTSYASHEYIEYNGPNRIQDSEAKKRKGGIPSQHYRTKLLLLHLSHIARAQMAQNLLRHLFLPFINSSVRSRQLKALRAQHNPDFIPHANLSSVPGIIQRVKESRGWLSVRFTNYNSLFLAHRATQNSQESGRMGGKKAKRITY